VARQILGPIDTVVRIPTVLFFSIVFRGCRCDEALVPGPNTDSDQYVKQYNVIQFGSLDKRGQGNEEAALLCEAFFPPGTY